MAHTLSSFIFIYVCISKNYILIFCIYALLRILSQCVRPYDHHYLSAFFVVLKVIIFWSLKLILLGPWASLIEPYIFIYIWKPIKNLQTGSHIKNFFCIQTQSTFHTAYFKLLPIKMGNEKSEFSTNTFHRYGFYAFLSDVSFIVTICVYK